MGPTLAPAPIVLAFAFLISSFALADEATTNPYSEFVKSFDEASAGWQSTQNANRKLLLNCKAGDGVGGGLRVSAQAVSKRRELLLNDYLKHLGRPNVSNSNRGERSDGLHFRVLSLKAGSIIGQPFSDAGADACDGSFTALITQVKGRIYQLQQLRKQLNFHQDNRMKQPNIDARFEKRHQKIASDQEPFRTGQVNRQDLCVPTYHKTLYALKQHHEGVVGATKELNSALNRDIARLLAYQGELMDRKLSCGAGDSAAN